MFIKEAHILIEQGLQNIGVFAHSEIHPEEVDLEIKAWIWKTMDDDFPNKRMEELTKPKLDKYAILIEKEIEFVVAQNGKGDYEVIKPDNYFHLIKCDSSSLFICGNKEVPSGQLEEGEWYINLGDTLIYNTISIPIRKTFQATANKNYSSPTIKGKPKVVKLKKKIGAVRFVEEEFSTTIINNSLTKPVPESPVGTMAGEKIIISVDGFFIEKAYISYLRKPKTPNINFQKIAAGVALTVGKDYEVIDGSVIYNGITYTAGKDFTFPSFKAVAGNPLFTGAGRVRIKGEGDIELPYQVALDIVSKVVTSLAIKSEQSGQKIQGLASLTT